MGGGGQGTIKGTSGVESAARGTTASRVGDAAPSASRVSLVKVLAYLAHRQAVCEEAFARYEAKREAARSAGAREMYRNMAATERCASLEIRHVREVIAGEKADRDWKPKRGFPA